MEGAVATWQTTQYITAPLFWQSHETVWLFKRKEKKQSKKFGPLIKRVFYLRAQSIKDLIWIWLRNTVKLKPSTYTKITFVNQEVVAFLSVSGQVWWPLTCRQLCPQHSPALIKSVRWSSTVITRYQVSRQTREWWCFSACHKFPLERNYRETWKTLLPFSNHSINMHQSPIPCGDFSMKQKNPSVFINSGFAAEESK